LFELRRPRINLGGIDDEVEIDGDRDEHENDEEDEEDEHEDLETEVDGRRKWELMEFR